MKISDYFRRREERKPVVLKDLTTFNLCRVRVSKRYDGPGRRPDRRRRGNGAAVASV